MTFADLINDAIRGLNDAGIAYMVTGSIASAYYGEPRATRDLDVVIDPDPGSIDVLVAGLIAHGYHVDRDAARSALERRSQFNAVGRDGLKVDYVIRRDRPFSLSEFERRQPVDLLGTPAFVVSIEDLIVAKLEWAVEGGSDVQLRDVAGILAVSGSDIDEGYLMRWIKALNLDTQWNRVADR